MPDKRVTELDPIDAVAAGDLLLLVDDPGGTPVNKKATVSQLLAVAPAPTLTETFLTENAEATLVNSRRLLAGTNIAFDTATPGQLTLSSTAAGGGGDVYLNVANVFTQDQTISKTRPALVLDHTGSTGKGRLFMSTPREIWLSTNISYNGTSWNFDDTAFPAGFAGIDSLGRLVYYGAPASANPAVYTNRLMITTDGTTTFSGQVRVTGINPGLQFGGTTAGFPALRCIPGGGATLEVTTADTPASVFAPLRASHFIAMNVGTNLGDLTCGAAVFTSTLSVAGAMEVTGGSATVYASAPIEIQMASYPRIGFHWPAVVASQIGMDSAGTIRTFDNPGTGYANFMAGNIQSSTNTWVSNLHTTGYVYPGNYGAGTTQATWFFAGHSSYGIYCNTGLYVAGTVWSGASFSAPSMALTGALSCDSIASTKGFRPRTWYSGYAHISPNVDTYDVYHVLDIAGTIIIYNGNSGGLDGFPITIMLRDNGGGHAISWDSLYMSACGVPLPAALTPSRQLYMGFRWNVHYGKWQMIAIAQE